MRESVILNCVKKRVSFLTEIFWCGFFMSTHHTKLLLFKYSELDETFKVWYGTSVDNVNKITLRVKYFHLLSIFKFLNIWPKYYVLNFFLKLRNNINPSGIQTHDLHDFLANALTHCATLLGTKVERKLELLNKTWFYWLLY